MKGTFTLLALVAIFNVAMSQSVAINTDGSNPDSSAILDIKSTAKGLLIPRMTTAQRSAIVNPATGLLVFQTDGSKGFYYRNGSAWYSLTDNLNNPWAVSGTNLYVRNFSYNAGIGTNTPRAALHIATGNGINLTLEDTTSLNTDVTTGMYFKTKDQYYGAVKAIGTGTTSGRMGFFTYSGYDSTALKERISITDPGNVGIGTTSPTAKLEVNGNTQVDGVASVTSDINVGGNAIVTGNMISNGLAAVVGSNGTQQRIVVYTATLSVTNLAANSLLGATGLITIPSGTFSGTPSAYVGDIVASSENGDYYRAVIIPDNVSATGVRIKIFNPTATAISFTNVTWKVFVIGPR